jgi:tRNA-specific 2-thiouridylase
VPETHDVVIGDRAELLSHALIGSRVNWMIDAPEAPLACRAKIRYRHDAASATVMPLADGAVRVDFAEPQSAITPGQAVVFYDGNRLLGGAWIEKAVGQE